MERPIITNTKKDMKKLVLCLALAAFSAGMSAQKVIPHHGGSEPVRETAPYRHHHYKASREQVGIVMDYLKSVSFDSDRLKAAKVCVSICPIPCDDLKDIVRMFSFDDRKMEIMKAAYGNCPDRENFWQVIRVLDWESNREKMFKFIEKYDRRRAE